METRIMICMVALLIIAMLAIASIQNTSFEDKVKTADEFLERHPWIGNMTIREAVEFAKANPERANALMNLACGR